MALETLNLSNNFLEKIDPDVLQRLTNLNNLDLSHNRLHSVEPNWFLPDKNNIIRMNLAYNNLGKYVGKLYLIMLLFLNRFSTASSFYDQNSAPVCTSDKIPTAENKN